MTARTCTLDHDTLTTRYCGQCGKKLEQPLQDLRAHLVSQAVKNAGKPTVSKWTAWIEALDHELARNV